MAAQLVEITGVYRGEFFRRDDFFIGEIRPTEQKQPKPAAAKLETFVGRDGRVRVSDSSRAGNWKIKGNAAPDELTPGLEYRFYGKWEHSDRYGDTFDCQTFVTAKPHSREGVIRYLQQAPNVGLSTATALWNKFAGDAVRILRETPAVAAASVGGGFTGGKAAEAAAKLAEMQSLEDCSIELIGLLSNRGLPKAVARQAIKAFGNRAAVIIQRNPYILMAFRGCGFMRADAMYLDLGLNPARTKRQSLCAWHAIASDSEGHIWYPVESIVRGITAKVGGASVNPPKALRLAVRARMLATRRDAENKLWVAEHKKAKAERWIAEHVAAAIATEGVDAEIPCWPTVEAADIEHGQKGPTQHQADAAAAATRAIIGCLIGSPGTGKTYLAACLVRLLIALFGSGEIAVAAPTGKAAVRITEAMQEYGIRIQATTIHRLLRVEQAADLSGTWGFCHREGNPLPYRFIVIDEASMVDQSLMASLLAARGRGTHILFVGDTNQLAPVGAGAPLRDFIAAGVPCGELREIHRNAGTIVKACAAIRDGEPFIADDQLAPEAVPPRNLKVIGAANSEQASAKIVEVLKTMRAKGLCDPVWDAQVIVAVNEKSVLSRKTLNKLLQAELNAEGEAVPGCPFRVGDKVVILKNGFLPAGRVEDARDFGGDADGKVFVANGEQGRVREIMEKAVLVELLTPVRWVKVPRGKGEAGGAGGETSGGNGGNDSGGEGGQGGGADGAGAAAGILDLAYAISCHKSQGSQWPVVIVALDEYPGARMVMSRNWTYTAISRAKGIVLPVGKLSTIAMSIRRDGLRRKTFLVELIAEERRRLSKAQGTAAQDQDKG